LAKYKSKCLKSKEFSEDNLFSSEKIVRDFVRGKAFVSALPFSPPLAFPWKLSTKDYSPALPLPGGL
jgi:hypothetical protein